ncbi:bifunctional glutamate N-acetyltransferase/amino-acid acetyltransferase ArgJ [Polymorphobacter fuscus]|uniref:Arginine biosynthesis bifunctional protein ArgJ n=1 Tax=Sandarakinorhabdus fusca TaxID=1439888 RepID=A0A7C9KKQ7_9SPHN|nr:bifunctional glutamate N-acetyltransferase/amino-acid acetyltransferase ArgJ [Polymorphobacter fuscus]KAB7647414.1 bifunctional glutamate N-acetyltransferase/amino-acid acetyltransferase ArgJ [Polymorphobacter fuscus]MQT16663.1 bifunctional glutamate N-acetyltransferase/amino-acid acetyltransferase ArgJ [Polymorphobacter fuscus]NJC09352.1 glutamate N-acetyltransferase/amino-acid N-acetyltransferase [Polymorphobacter fuscus]
MTISPLARPFPALAPITGVRIGTATAGYKNWSRADVTLVELAAGTSVAGVLTRSRCPSPEVELCRERLAGGQARALVVNAGNSNAFTGLTGRQAAAAQTAAAATLVGCAPEAVFAASTGVIGVPLPQDKAVAGVTAAHAALGTGDFHAATLAIGTTDTFAKAATTAALVGDTRVTLTGIIKGSGMIAPDMATMLGFIFTDAAVAPAFLQAALDRANATSFSCITVDGDTSTSDTVLAFATGAAGHAPLTGWDSPGADAFAAALADLCRQLAQLVVRDGEGATKFITISVTGAESDAAAHRIGMSIANSPLVKTAIAGGDANWGRVVMAVGKAGEAADRDRLSIRFGTTEVAAGGAVVPGYDEAPVAAHLAGEDVEIAVDLGLGSGRARVWTCDLTHGYISINADYRS